jgi:hypothetical protein
MTVYTKSNQKHPPPFRSSLALVRVAICGVLMALVGCAKSPAPVVSDLVVIGQPLISGVADVNLTASSQMYLLNGTCDPNTYVLQYSYNGTNWIEHAAGCVNGTFSILVKIPIARDVHVRARGKFSFTASAVAHIHFIAPKTSEFLGDTVTASRSEIEVSDDPGTISQYVVSHNFTGETYTNATRAVHLLLPGVIYE